MPRTPPRPPSPVELALLDLTGGGPALDVPLTPDGTPADAEWQSLAGDLGRALVVERGWQGTAPARTVWLARAGVALDASLAWTDGPLTLRLRRATGAPPLIPPQSSDADALAVRLCDRLARLAPGPPRIRPADPLTGGLARVLTSHGPITDDPSLVPTHGFREERPRLVVDVGGGRTLRWHTADSAGVVEVPVEREGPVPARLLEATRAACVALAAVSQQAAERTALVDRNALLQAAMDVCHDGFLAGSPDGDLLLYSNRLEEISSWTRAEVEAHGWAPLAYPDPAYRARVQEWIRSHFLGQQFDAWSVAITRRDGTRRECLVKTSLVPTSHGVPAVIGAFRDVTPLREEARSEARQDSLDALGRLAGTIAHDFRNLLAAIMGHANILELRADPDGPVAERARRIASAAERGDALTRRLLTFGGARPASLGPVDLARVVREAVDLRRPTLPPGLEVDVHADGRLPAAYTDAALLGEALDNLLVNAVQASSGAPGRVRVELARTDLPTGASFCSPGLRGEVLRVRVHDPGPGFTADARAHLFEPFWSSRRGGHGIGLAAVRSIMGILSGAIDVPDTARGGVVDLFVPASSAPAPSDRATPEAPPRGDEALWVVDDDPALIELTESALTALGYTVRGFSSGEEALAAVDGGDTPDLFLLDVVMPGLKGPEVLAALRARGLRTPVLYCTGMPPDGLATDERVRVLEKPFTLRALGRAVRALLERTVLVPGRDRPR